MRLFNVGYAETANLIVAENETESILQFIKKYPHLSSLPLVSEQIQDNEFEIVALNKDELKKLEKLNVTVNEPNKLKTTTSNTKRK